MNKSIVLPLLALTVAATLVASVFVPAGTLQAVAQSEGQQGQSDQDRETRKQRVIDRVRGDLAERGVFEER